MAILNYQRGSSVIFTLFPRREGLLIVPGGRPRSSRRRTFHKRHGCGSGKWPAKWHRCAPSADIGCSERTAGQVSPENLVGPVFYCLCILRNTTVLTQMWQDNNPAK